MSLLTRDERKQLAGEDRRKLRKERAKAKRSDPKFWVTKVKNAARQVVVSLGGKYDQNILNTFIDNAITEVLDLGPDASTEDIISEVSDIVGDELDKLLSFDKAVVRFGPITLPIGAVLEKIDGRLFDSIAYLVASSLVRARIEEKRPEPKPEVKAKTDTPEDSLTAVITPKENKTLL